MANARGRLVATAGKSRALLLMAGLAALLAIGLATRFWPRPSDEGATSAAADIARQCAGGQHIENTAQIESGLSKYLTTASARATVTSQNVGTVTSMLRPDGVSLEIYKAYTQCLKDQTEAYLKLKGVTVVPQQPVSTAMVSEIGPTSTAAPVAMLDRNGRVGQVLTGYVYYEENDGHATEDGVFEPYAKAPLSRYERLSQGMVLRTVRPAEVREGPTGNDSPIDARLDPRQCVRVIGKPDYPPNTPLKHATSGGWIRVEAIACPQRPRRTTTDSTASAPPRPVPVGRVGPVNSVNQSGGITAGQIGVVTVEAKP